jgi:hypothetical protein
LVSTATYIQSHPEAATSINAAIHQIATGGKYGLGGVYNEGGDAQSDEGGAKIKTGARTEPRDLQEQLALEEAKAGAGKDYSGDLGDPKYHPVTGTEDKKTHSHDHGDGTTTEIHYDVNRSTGERSGFKIKDDTNAKSRGHLPTED